MKVVAKLRRKEKAKKKANEKKRANEKEKTNEKKQGTKQRKRNKPGETELDLEKKYAPYACKGTM